jgi:hypothetical protein
MMYDNVSQSFLYPAQQLLVLIAIQRTQWNNNWKS